MPGDAQLNVGSGGGAAPNTEMSADSLCPLVHSWQSPMSISPGLEYFGVNSTTVIPDENSKLLFSIFNFHFNACRAGVPKSVHDRLTANAIDFVAEHGRQWLRAALYNYAIRDLLRNAKFFLHPRKRLFQIQRSNAADAQAVHRVSAVFYDASYKFEDMT
jgi:hypothetical protein